MSAVLFNFPVQEGFEDRLSRAHDASIILAMATQAAASPDCIVGEAQLLALFSAATDLQAQLRKLLDEVERKNGGTPGDD